MCVIEPIGCYELGEIQALGRPPEKCASSGLNRRIKLKESKRTADLKLSSAVPINISDAFHFKKPP